MRTAKHTLWLLVLGCKATPPEGELCEQALDCGVDGAWCSAGRCTANVGYSGVLEPDESDGFERVAAPLQRGERGDSFCGVEAFGHGDEHDEVAATEYGFAWQSTEFVARYLCEGLGVCVDEPHHGPAWTWAAGIHPSAAVGTLSPFPSPGPVPPVPGDVLVFGSDAGRPWGHVSVVADVDLVNGSLSVVQQGCPGCGSQHRVYTDGHEYWVPEADAWLRPQSVSGCADAPLEVWTEFGAAVVGGTTRVFWSPAHGEDHALLMLERNGSERVVLADTPDLGRLDVDLAVAALEPADDWRVCLERGDQRGCSSFIRLVDASSCADGDGDGWGIGDGCAGPDCNDALATAYPYAPELLDGQDNDCNGRVDEAFRTSLLRITAGFGVCESDLGNWDHCFSLDGSSCVGSGQGGGSAFVSDGSGIRVYDASLTQQELDDAGLVGLVALQACYNPLQAMHWYGPWGEEEDRLQHAEVGWLCHDARIGWVYPLGIPVVGDGRVVEKGIVETMENLHFGFLHEDSGIRSHPCYEFHPAFVAWEMHR